MRESRIHCPQNLSQGQEIVLSAESSHYLANVLRLKVDAAARVFNAECGEYRAQVSSIKKGEVTLLLGEQLQAFSAPVLSLHLCLGISRGDRMDYGIQKSVELGVSEITPMYSEFGEVRFKQADRLTRKLSHWQRIATSAAEQSGRLDVPTVNEPLAFSDCIGLDQPLVLFDPSGDSSIESLSPSERLTIITGPEGGFSAAELEQTKTAQCLIVKLGPRVLRTETAPVAALAIVQHRFGDL